MATAATATTMTAESLAAEAAAAPRPEVVDEPLYEMIDGRIVEKPPMGAYQVWITSILTVFLHGPAAVNPMGRVVGEMLFTLDAGRKLKRRPDVAFVSYDRWPRRRPVPNEETWSVVPNLAVEVISPSNAADEVVKKVGDYFRAGVRLVWVVYPIERLVYVYRSAVEVRVLQVGDDLDGGDVLPGFRQPVRDLFEEPGEAEPGAEEAPAPAAG
jgi:Uma2 family endonuclease